MSLYNETSGTPIFPTPTVVVVGLLEPWGRHAVSHFAQPGRSIVLLGETRDELGGSAWLALRAGLEAGRPPIVDLDAERRLHALLAEGVKDESIETAHDISDGGLAVALAECCFANTRIGSPRIGASIALAGALSCEVALFGESTGRVLVATDAPDALLALARRHGVPAARIGETGGDRLAIAGPDGANWIDTEVDRLHDIWRRGLPRRLEAE